MDIIEKIIYPRINHPLIVKYLHDLGLAYKDTGECKQAIDKYLQKSLEMGEEIYKGDHPDIARSLNSLGLAWIAEEKYDKAIKCHIKSANMWERIHQGRYHSEVLGSSYSLGIAYLHNQQHSEAIGCFKKLLAMVNSQDPQNSVVFGLKYNLAMSCQSIGQYDEAIKYSIQALQIVSIVQGQLIEIVSQFIDFDDQNTIEKVISSTQQRSDFTDYQLYYGNELSQANILECKLAWIFFPKEQLEEQLKIKQTICNKLAQLTKEDQKNIELWLAIVKNNIAEIQKLADDKIDLNYASFMNTTPLIQAIKTGNIAMVSALLSGNIDTNKPNNDQEQITPLYYSLGFNRQPINMKIVESITNYFYGLLRRY